MQDKTQLQVFDLAEDAQNKGSNLDLINRILSGEVYTIDRCE